MNTTAMRIPSNRVRDIERYMHAELDGQYPAGEVQAFAYILFEAFVGWDKTHYLLHRDETIDQSDLLKFHWAVEDLKAYRPIQHIVGFTTFCGCKIQVSGAVLIPRPETEQMVCQVIGHTAPAAHGTSLWLRAAPATIVDLCTGSGCIAIALKKAFPQAQVTAIDLSPEALAIARQNATENGADVAFLQADILHDTIPSPPQGQPFGTVDLLIANPPYVRESERPGIARNVLDYDPPEALFVPDAEPLLFYEAIGAYAVRRLSAEGLMVVEINEALASETQSLLTAKGLHAEVHDDFRGKKRYITAHR